MIAQELNKKTLIDMMISTFDLIKQSFRWEDEEEISAI